MNNLTPTEIAGFFENGFIIIRNALPLSLISDLRRECEKATALSTMTVVLGMHQGAHLRVHDSPAYHAWRLPWLEGKAIKWKPKML